MNPMLFLILGVVIAALAVVGAIVSISAAKRNFESQKVDFDKEANRVRDDARRDAESKAKEIVLEAKDKAYQVIQNAEKETRRKQSELDKLQHRLNSKEEALDKKALSVENKEQDLSDREKAVIEREKEITHALDLEKAKLQEIAELTVEEARSMLLTNLEKELKKEYATMIKEYGDRAKAESKRRSQQIVSMAIQRCAVDHVAESTVSVVQLSSDEMKGRIIGREGRNIRAFENLTGVDLVVDDTPEAVVISAFDPIRREIARQSLEKLVSDGRIHPARIEEIVEKTRAELEANIIEEGEKVTYEMKMTDLHPEIVKLLGRLKYRTSYGQNVLQHSIEVANLAASMASDLDVSVPLAKRGGLLHDIGKAVDFEVEGPHALIGGDLAKRYRESKGICHIINSHHADQEPLTIEAVLVQVADAVSGSRPGARREDLESYIKRLTRLEDLAVDFPGVDKAFAIQAGRELRIVVKPDSVDDDEAIILAREVAKKIEHDLSYPGQIKVHVIRETRAVDYAK